MGIHLMQPEAAMEAMEAAIHAAALVPQQPLRILASPPGSTVVPFPMPATRASLSRYLEVAVVSVMSVKWKVFLAGVRSLRARNQGQGKGLSQGQVHASDFFSDFWKRVRKGQVQ